MDKTGHCLSFSQTAQVSSTQPHVGDLTVMVGQLQMNLQQYTESSSLLIAALERMEESQNVTLSSLQFDVRQLQDQHKSLETAVTSQISQWQLECQVLTDLHKSYLPRTCKDVVSDEPRAVVVLSDGLEVLCDTETDGGGWLVTQRRFNGEEDFYRNWEDYKYGFGDINGEFWFGNEKTHRLTTQRQYELRVDFTYNSTNYYAEYSRIIVYGEPEKYKLKLGSYSGNAGDTLSIRGHNMAFTTKDRDNDIDSSVNCAQRFTGAWWYANCHLANLNGLWGSKDYGKGLNWVNTTGAYDSATFTEMKIRPIALN